MSYSSSLASRTAWNAIASLISTFGRMLVAIFIARQLEPTLAGQYAFLTWLVEFIIIIISFGLPNTLTKYAAEFSTKEKKINLFYWIMNRYIFLSFGGTIIIYIIGVSYFSDITSFPIAIILPILLFIQSISALLNAYLAGQQDFKKIAKINILSSTTLVISQLILVPSLGVSGALLGTTICYAMSLIWFIPLVKKNFNQSKHYAVPDSLLKYTVYTWLAAIVSAIIWARSELFFLNHFSTHEQSGYFSVAQTLTSFVILGANLLTGALMPHFSSIVGRNNHAKLQQDYARLTMIVALFVFPISLGSIAIMDNLLPFVFGSAYTEAITTGAILMATGILAFAGVGSSLIYALGKSDFIFQWGLVGAILLIIGCYLIVPTYGAVGAASIRLSIQILMVIITAIFIQRHLKIMPPYKVLFLLIISSALSAATIKLTINYFSFMPFLSSIICGILSYVFCLRIFKALHQEDIATLISLTKYLPCPIRRKTIRLLHWTLG